MCQILAMTAHFAPSCEFFDSSLTVLDVQLWHISSLDATRGRKVIDYYRKCDDRDYSNSDVPKRESILMPFSEMSVTRFQCQFLWKSFSL
jgi:hypothetical protein